MRIIEAHGAHLYSRVVALLAGEGSQKRIPYENMKAEAERLVADWNTKHDFKLRMTKISLDMIEPETGKESNAAAKET